VQVKKGVYDATPALVNEFTVDYQYDEMGRMLRRDDSTDVTDYFYDGWDIWKEVTGESVTEYLVPSLSVQSFLRDGELFTLHSDGISSVRVVTDSEGDVAARIELGAWGETLPGSVDLVPGGLTADFVGALGVRRDTLTGLILMRNRWYTPTFGCFVSRDPISLRGGPNLYSYCSGAPIMNIDPFGLDDLEGTKAKQRERDQRQKKIPPAILRSKSPNELVPVPYADELERLLYRYNEVYQQKVKIWGNGVSMPPGALVDSAWAWNYVKDPGSLADPVAKEAGGCYDWIKAIRSHLEKHRSEYPHFSMDTMDIGVYAAWIDHHAVIIGPYDDFSPLGSLVLDPWITGTPVVYKYRDWLKAVGETRHIRKPTPTCFTKNPKTNRPIPTKVSDHEKWTQRY